MEHAGTVNSLVLTSILGWGLWGVFDKRALAYASPPAALVALYAFCLPLAGLTMLGLQAVQPGWRLTAPLMAWTGLAALVQFTAMTCYLNAMKRTEASYVLGITAAYPLITQLMAVLLLGEDPVAMRILGGSLVVTGVLAVSGSLEPKTTTGIRSSVAQQIFPLVMLATCLWGVVGIIDKKAVALAHPLEAYLAKCIWFALFIVLTLVVLRKRKVALSLRDGNLWTYSGISACFGGAASLAYLGAMALAPASYVIVVTACYPLTMYLFALIILKERFNPVRMCGIGAIVAGGMLAQATQLL